MSCKVNTVGAKRQCVVGIFLAWRILYSNDVKMWMFKLRKWSPSLWTLTLNVKVQEYLVYESFLASTVKNCGTPCVLFTDISGMAMGNYLLGHCRSLLMINIIARSKTGWPLYNDQSQNSSCVSQILASTQQFIIIQYTYINPLFDIF